MAVISLARLRQIVRECITEAMGAPRGGLRTSQSLKDKGSSGQKFRIGKADPDENGEISSIDVRLKFPGAIEAWGEVAPELFPEIGTSDPRAVAKKSVWFVIDGKLRVAFAEMPQLELAEWRPGHGEDGGDWFELLDSDEDEDDLV